MTDHAQTDPFLLPQTPFARADQQVLRPGAGRPAPRAVVNSLAPGLALLLLGTGCGKSPPDQAENGGDGIAAEDGASDDGSEGSNDSGNGGGDEVSFDEGGGGDDGDSGAAEGGDDDEGGASGGEGDLPFFDLGSLPDTPPPEEGCAKVDFLFVIDNSGSMADEQDNLRNSFRPFMEAIETTLELDDFHVMVVDTDTIDDNGGVCGTLTTCNGGVCTCQPAGTCCPCVCKKANTVSCNGTLCSDLDDDDDMDAVCARTLGGGRDKNTVTDAGCNFAGDRRYMTREDGDLITAFSCAATVGNDGDGNERPMNAMEEAIGDALVGPGGCNEGFLREDAILVVTVITDEEEKGGMMSTGNPESWKQSLVDAKGGNEDAIVVLGLIGDNDLGMDAICEPFDGLRVGAEPSPILRRFVKSFGAAGLDASVCAEDYGPFFVEAVGAIDNACDIFDPPGR